MEGGLILGPVRGLHLHVAVHIEQLFRHVQVAHLDRQMNGQVALLMRDETRVSFNGGFVFFHALF